MQLLDFNCICNNILALCVPRVNVCHGNDCHHSTSHFLNVLKNYLFLAVLGCHCSAGAAL